MPFDPNTLIHDVALHLATVSGVGVIHEYRRKVQSEADAGALWVPSTPLGNAKINAWSVSLGEPTVNSTRGPGFNGAGTQAGRVLSDIAIAIEGVYGIDDAAQSEVAFRALAWNVVCAFNAVGRIQPYIVQQGPMQWQRSGYLVLASLYTVHYVRLGCAFVGQVYP